MAEMNDPCFQLVQLQPTQATLATPSSFPSYSSSFNISRAMLTKVRRLRSCELKSSKPVNSQIRSDVSQTTKIDTQARAVVLSLPKLKQFKSLNPHHYRFNNLM